MQRYENNKTASFTPHAPYAKHYLPLTQNTAEMEYSNLSQVRISPYTPPRVIRPLTSLSSMFLRTRASELLLPILILSREQLIREHAGLT
jgi:hypothetical protein